MELIKVTPKESLTFKLKDGRIGVCYTSGYVRVNTKGSHTNPFMYQINKKVVDKNNNHRRILIPKIADQVRHLQKFEQKNCK